jgi:DNA invertase Pin-like site-specific DNA recombinase
VSLASKKPLRVIGYARVSTHQQGDSGLGIAAQRAALEQAASDRGYELVDVLADVASAKRKNGKLDNRKAAMERVEAGEADGILVAKLDRLARSFLDFAEILERAQRKRWALVIVEPNIDLSTPAGRMVAGILATVAEFERELVSERTKNARAAAVAAGKPVGGRPLGKYEIPAEIRERIARERDEHRSFRAIARGLDADGIKPARAGSWSAETVRQVVLAEIAAA